MPGATGAPGEGGEGATGTEDCSSTCQYTIERTIWIMGEPIVFGGNSFEVAPLITTGYLIDSRYILGGIPFPDAPLPNPNCPTEAGDYILEKFTVIVEDCSNSCPVSNNLGNGILNGIETHSSEPLTCFQGTINSGSDIELNLGERIKLDRGFKIIQGAELEVRIGPCN